MHEPGESHGSREVFWLFLPVGVGVAIGLNAGADWIAWVATAAGSFAVAHVVLRSRHYRQFIHAGGDSNVFYLGVRFVVEALKVGVPAVLAITIAVPSKPTDSRTPWPAGAVEAYVARCTDEMVTQRLGQVSARSFCTCIARGLEREFGMEEYQEMMDAQPDKQGNSFDRRLYQVVGSCQGSVR